MNPSNDGFRQALRSQIYVDKTGSILNTKQKFIAVSRARRFGKSMATELLMAYYSKDCDSRELFKGLKAETLPSFESELNKSNAITRAIGEKFIIIIDEWDCIFREEKNNKQAQDEYINFLRAMFKGQQTESFVKLAYLTGILLRPRPSSKICLAYSL